MLDDIELLNAPSKRGECMRRKKPAFITFTSIFVGVCILLGGQQGLKVALAERPTEKEEKLITAVFEKVYDEYVTPVKTGDLLSGALDGMINLLSKERVSYRKDEETLFVSSSNESIKVNLVNQKTGGKDGLITTYRFIVKHNLLFDPMDIAHATIKGMLESLDPHSGFMRPEVFKEMQAETKGRFEGLGIEITMKDGILTVVAPFDGSPASKGGILAGDQILMINGEPTKNLTLMDSGKKMRGPRGSQVTITIMREGFTKPRDFTLTRDVIPVRSVRHELLEEKYGYIRISKFPEKTDSEFDKAVKALEDESRGILKGLVLDLRNNPGGLLDQVVKIADRFIDSGIIVSIQGRKEDQKQRFYAHFQGTLPRYSLVVLVNGGTSSGSEIVTGALRDHQRGIILGTQTFGKGSVQTIFPLPDGSGLRLTTAMYTTPQGFQIQKNGIVPDFIIVTQKQEEQEVKRKREKDLEKALPGKESSLLTGKPKLVLKDDDKDVVVRIASRILSQGSSGTYIDLMAAANEVAKIEMALTIRGEDETDGGELDPGI
jgi:carboxyl-terminal processing protease